MGVCGGGQDPARPDLPGVYVRPRTGNSVPGFGVVCRSQPEITDPPDAGDTAPVLRRVAIEATEGVAEFCRHGWVHRDIKPDNFLVDETGKVKLIDFGLAHRAKKGLSRYLARKTKVQGTRSYMSPEQIRGKPLDERADLYSLACTLFEMFSGKPPYTGLSANDLLMQHIKSPVPWLKTRNPDATSELSDLLQVAMAKDPERRQSSVQEFLAKLRSIKMSESVADWVENAENAAE